MAKRAGAVARMLRTPTPAETTDRDLLARFAGGEQEAFAQLVRWHTALVFGMCRRALPTVQDAEDATQAVFLVLAKKAAGTRWHPSVANWLYATARRVTARVQRSNRRRSEWDSRSAPPATPSTLDEMSGRELLAALDDELDRLPPIYREPIVLCQLQGLTRDEAAARLGVPTATVKIRLERGRKRLADALTNRGVGFGAALLAVAATSPAGASPPALVQSVLSAVNGSPSAAATALARGAVMSGVLTRTKLLAVAGLVAVCFGLVAVAADPPQMDKPKADDKKPADDKGEGTKRTITGTVVGPDGKPLEGASINIPRPNPKEQLDYLVHELAKTDKDGKFAVTIHPRQNLMTQVGVTKKGFAPDWMKLEDLVGNPVVFKLAADDVPVKGRLTDLEGKPVAKATVRVQSISEPDFAKMWEQWAVSPDLALRQEDRKTLLFIKLGHVGTVETDAEGRFELTGIGRGRMLGLTFEGDGIATSACRVVLDPKFDPNTVARPKKRRPGDAPGPILHGPTFTHSAHPSQRVSGTITDAKTGKPVAGVRVLGYGEGPHRGEAATTLSGADGKFVLKGLPKTEGVQLTLLPDEKQPYLRYVTAVAGKPGLTEITAELKLSQGVVLKGQVVEKGSGKPVAGAYVSYFALADNKYHAELFGGSATSGEVLRQADAEGRFRLVVLPGSGVVTARVATSGRDPNPYTQVRVTKEDAALARYDPGFGENFSGIGGGFHSLIGQSGYAVINPKPTDDTIELTLQFDRGKTVTGTVVGPDGKAAAGVKGYSLSACTPQAQPLTDGRFTALALDPDRPRTVLFADAAQKLAASVTLKGDEKDVTVKLEPWGKVSGRLLSADGKPVAGARVSVVILEGAKYRADAEIVRDLAATTAADGTFTLDVPGGPVEYVLILRKNGAFLNTGNIRFKVKPNEKDDVGDLKIKE